MLREDDVTEGKGREGKRVCLWTRKAAVRGSGAWQNPRGATRLDFFFFRVTDEHNGDVKMT